MMNIRPQAWYKQLASVLKPFYDYRGKEFFQDLEEELENLGLDNYAEAVKLACNHLEANYG